MQLWSLTHPVFEEDQDDYFRQLKFLKIFYVARTGCQWSNITPPRNVSYKTVFARFANWSKIGVFETAFSGLAKLAGDRASRRRSVLCTDTSYVKNIQGRGPTLGRNHTDRGRKATKVSVLTDDKGIPLHFCFHPANKNDCTLLRHLLDSASRCIGPLGRFQSLYADKGYDSQTCRTFTWHWCTNSKKRATGRVGHSSICGRKDFCKFGSISSYNSKIRC